jgi:hypothetical protein
MQNENHGAEPVARANDPICHALCSEQHRPRQLGSRLIFNVSHMKTIAVCLLPLCVLAGCATQVRVAPGMPVSSVVLSPKDLAGRYANVGLVHHPSYNRPSEAFLDVALGAYSPTEGHRGDIIIEVEDDRIILIRIDGLGVPSKRYLKKDIDYLETHEGLKFSQIQKGSGEGILTATTSTTLWVRLSAPSTIILEARSDERGIGGIFFPLPYRDSYTVWYEFKKEANK